MPGIPPSDQQSAPTRGDLAVLIGTRANGTDAKLDLALAAIVNLQQQVTALTAALAALDGRLTGASAEPGGDNFGWLGAILTAARTD